MCKPYTRLIGKGATETYFFVGEEDEVESTVTKFMVKNGGVGKCQKSA